MIVRIVSVNVSEPRWIEDGDRKVLTGIFKEPVSGTRRLTATNLEGDGQADLVNHGGHDKAVYVYPHEHYPAWAEELGRTDLSPGQFGENLTTRGLLEDSLCIGDTFRAGTALLQVSQPRVPCAKLGIRMGDPAFVKVFLKSLRSGFYCRVLEEGTLAAQDPIAIETRDPECFTVRDIMHLHFFDKKNVAQLDRALSLTALAESWQEPLTLLRAKL